MGQSLVCNLLSYLQSFRWHIRWSRLQCVTNGREHRVLNSLRFPIMLTLRFIHASNRFIPVQNDEEGELSFYRRGEIQFYYIYWSIRHHARLNCQGIDFSRLERRSPGFLAVARCSADVERKEGGCRWGDDNAAIWLEIILRGGSA